MLLRALLILCLSFLGAHSAVAADEPGARIPDAYAPDARAYKKNKDKKSDEELSEEDKRVQEEEERKRREMLARVIVLKWPGKDTDYMDETVRRNVRSRIARPEAWFFPEVDLYQNGRKVPDRTVIPANQPAVVPEVNAIQVEARALEVLALPWETYTSAQWYQVADGLRQLADAMWFVDRPELRKPIFLLYAAIGYASFNADNTGPPFFEVLGGQTVNFFFYQAALLAYREPGLTGNLASYPEAKGPIEALRSRMEQGGFPSYKLDFEQENVYIPEIFNESYEVLINGLPVELDQNARTDLFLGRNDVYLKRKDTGHGLSERLALTRIEDKAYFVRDVARKRMGIEFIDQLFLDPYACLPALDGDILNYLAIYQKLHEKADVYIAVPEKGSPNAVFIWKYDRERAQLTFISGGKDSFPVRFAFLFSSGLLYNGATPTIDDNLEDESSLAPGDVANTNRLNVDKEPALVPFDFELRGHYNRLMVNVGAEFGYNVGKNAKWQEYYQTPGKQKEEDIYTARLSNCGPAGALNLDTNGDGEADAYDGDGDGVPDTDLTCDSISEVYNSRQWNRHLYLGAGVVLGRDAGIGFGPRFAVQWGWLNIPHGWQATGHFGWAIQPPFPEAGGRVRPMVDLDLRGGVAIARPRSLQRDLAEQTKNSDKPERNVEEVFGANLGVGLTF